VLAHDRLKELLDETPVSKRFATESKVRLGATLAVNRELKSTTRSSSERLERIRAEARQDWLKHRQTSTKKESSNSKIDPSANRLDQERARDDGLEFDDDSET
jgi:hypothetical protein